MSRSAEVVVIGAGVIGLAAAWRLALEGRSVTVLDRDRPGGLASRAAAGMLAPSAETDAPDALFELARASRALYPDFVRRLQEDIDREVDFREDGLLAVPLDELEESDLARAVEWQRAAGIEVEELPSGEVARRWPELELPRPPGSRADVSFGENRVFYFPGEAQVDNDRLVDALLAACAGCGVELLLGCAVQGLRVEKGGVVGVELDAGGRLSCGSVVNAAGAWAGVLAEAAGESLPVEPVRGEMVAYARGERLPRPIVIAGGAYALARRDGRVLVGATVDRAGFDAVVTAEGQSWLEARAHALMPSLAGLAPTQRWAGLRPATPDGLPVIGPSAEVRGLYHASGHFRNGILLAPLTAEVVARELAGEEVPHEGLSSCRPTRFTVHAGAAS